MACNWRGGLVCLALLVAVGGALRAQDAGDDIIQLVIGLLREKDNQLRGVGLEQVRGAAPGRRATERFAAELPRLPADAQIALIRALAVRGDQAARPQVLVLIDSSDDTQVRAAAIAALGSLGEPSDLPLLLKRFHEAEPELAEAARDSLVRLAGPEVSARIASELARADAPLKIKLIEVLAQRRALDMLPQIAREAIDDAADVRMAAMAVLGELAGPDLIPAMVQGILKAEQGREREAAEKALMFVCHRIPDASRQAEPLIAAMSKLPSAQQTMLLSALGRVGGDAARRLVEEAVADSDRTRHAEGIRALCNWPDASVAARLEKLATSDPHPSHRISALRALIRVSALPDERSDEQRLALLRKAMDMATRDDERLLALRRAPAIRTVETLRFLLPYLDQPRFAQQACLAVVELAHHRPVREPNKEEFDRALDKVIATSKDEVVIDRARRYKRGETWVRPE